MLNSLTKLLHKDCDNASDGELVFHPSRTCPECGTKLAAGKDKLDESYSAPRDGDMCNSSLRNEDSAWHCPNLDCPARLRDQLEHWCSAEALDISLADKSLVGQLVKQGLVRDVAELYSLKLSEVAALEGRDKEFAKRFLGQLADSKTREAWRLLYGLDIPEVDAGAARQLCRCFPAVDDILAAGPERLIKQAGVSLTVAKSIAFWFGDRVNRRLVRRLQRAGLNFKTGA